MAPTTELEEWEKQKAIDIFEKSNLSDGREIHDRGKRSSKIAFNSSIEVEALNYPNPFNPSTTIQYALNEPAIISLQVFDILGRRVAQLVNSTQEAGTHHAIFDATRMATGMYIYRLSVNGNPSITNTMLLIK
ncbi:MAG: T9SS type A sorting domain-containing protein [Balneolales bacterium]|nr:T9SS type A sorting domain-containing protein [Balneolales bacterium]